MDKNSRCKFPLLSKLSRSRWNCKRGGIYMRTSLCVSSRLETLPASRPRLIRIYDASTSRSSPSTAVDNSTNDPERWRTLSSDKAAAYGAAFAGYPANPRRKGTSPSGLVGGLSLKRAALTYSTGRARVARHTGVGSVFAISGNNDTGYHRCETSVSHPLRDQ